MTQIICLTGGIGSGKTTVAQYIQSKGIPVYIADTEAKKIMDTPEMQAQIQLLFNEPIIENNLLNRKKIAQQVFTNPEKLKQLNQLVHPKVQQHFTNWVHQHNTHPLVVREAAILFESGSYVDCQQIILVTAPLPIRIQRVQKRDHITETEILNRINNQWTDDEKRKYSTYVIENINLPQTYQQTDQILSQITNQNL